MTQNELLDTWEVSGTDSKELDAVIASVTKSTKSMTRNGINLRFYVVMENDAGEPTLVHVAVDPMREMCELFETTKNLEKGLMSKWEKKIAEESWQNGLILSYEDTNGNTVFMPCSKTVQSDFAFLGITGKVCELNTYHLAGVVAQQAAMTGDITIVSRESDDGNLEKVMSLRSKQYMYIPMMETLDITKNMFPDGELEKYYVSNNYTEAFYKFPNETAVVPFRNGSKEIHAGIQLRDSNTGFSASGWKLFWDLNGSKVFLASGKAEVTRKHKGTFDNKVKDSIKSQLTDLRKKLKEFPKKMEELDHIELYQGEALDVLAHLMEDNKDYKRLIKQEVRDALLEEAKDVFNLPVHTAAEVVMYLLQTPDRITEITPAALNRIREICGEFPYMKIRRAQTLKN